MPSPTLSRSLLKRANRDGLSAEAVKDLFEYADFCAQQTKGVPDPDEVYITWQESFGEMG